MFGMCLLCCLCFMDVDKYVFTFFLEAGVFNVMLSTSKRFLIGF